MQQINTSADLFSLTADLVNLTSKNIFLTGNAGTGKTTFLRYIRENSPKKLAVVAPTGVAAINAGGVTIHSFFQLPLSPFLPSGSGFEANDQATNKHSLLARLRLNREKRKILQELELLIIDEISMVRCDLLDAIDLVLRHVRHRHDEPFGGLQLLFIGDLFQLPPVVKDAEWKLLHAFYDSPYFFDSQVVKQHPPICISFTKIYRQTEESFIRLLNQVRNNNLDEQGLEALNQRYQPDFFGSSTDNFILLTTHNEKARQINAQELEKLSGRLYRFKAITEGEFPSTAFPADEELQLKAGAQVMFIKNDPDKAKRFYNGKIGVVTKVQQDRIFVQCKDEAEPVEVGREKWENIRYSLDSTSRQLKDEVLGSFSQYPLRLAWAITIHKSQGLTFDKAIIDAGLAFAPGQVYVALSRCTSLQGLVLHSKIHRQNLFADQRILQFTQNIMKPQDLELELAEAKNSYRQKIVFSLFDFQISINELKGLQKLLQEHETSFNAEALAWCNELQEKLLALQTTADKFKQQLRPLFESHHETEENPALKQRINAGAHWFSKQINLLLNFIRQSPAVTDSTLHAKEYNELLREVFLQLAQQNFLLQGFEGKLDMEAFHRRKKNFLPPPFGVNAYAAANEKQVALAHPKLFYQLKKLRDSICSRKNLPVYWVAGSKSLEEMSTYLPLTLEELQKIRGFGRVRTESYGREFLAIIQQYAAENNLSSSVAEKTAKRKQKEAKEKKPDTKAETFRLYKQGKSPAEIAAERKLSIQTIEGHLAFYVEQGQVEIDALVSREKRIEIEKALQQLNGSSLTAVKEALGEAVSYGEIRLVMAAMRLQASPPHVNH